MLARQRGPIQLDENIDRSFQGCIPLGMGFTFDDTEKKGIAPPFAEMYRLIEKSAHNKKHIFLAPRRSTTVLRTNTTDS